jgi:hypothetical protein
MRERIAIVLDDIVKLLGESGGFFVCKLLKVHSPDMGARLAVAKARGWAAASEFPGHG